SAKLLALCLGLVAMSAINSAYAASATWNGNSNNTWSVSSNWSASPAPGVNDTATFSNSAVTVNNNTNIDLSAAGITISNIVFDTSSAASYTIGTGAIGSQTVTAQANAAITMNATVATPQLINANILLGTN